LRRARREKAQQSQRKYAPERVHFASILFHFETLTYPIDKLAYPSRDSILLIQKTMRQAPSP
jgi:hypothetical protein